jgi:hypothetical protein
MWIGELAAMVQVSLIAYLAAGAFLGMAYFDLPYNLVVMIVMSKVILRREGLLGTNPASFARPPTRGVGGKPLPPAYGVRSP